MENAIAKAKDNNTIAIPRETQIAIMKFFLRTSIPRMLKSREVDKP